MKHMVRIFIIFSLMFTLAGLAVAPASAATTAYPTFSIVSVVTDTSVTIQTYNLPASDSFDVLMNFMHTQGIGGIKVATLASGAGGSQTLTYNIPASLQGQYQIAIRLQSPTSGFFAYNWFYNKTGGAVPPVSPPVYPGYPTFSIVSVVTDTSVTIQTYNLPASDSFDVLMNFMHTQGIGGVKVATQASGTGGSQTFTYNIPDSLKGQYQIAIRMQSPTSGYYAYNWFYNNTSGTVPPPVPPVYVGYPTFSIVSVVKDTSVTIKTSNLPANVSFDVLMNYMHTLGIGGIKVATQASGAGGSQTFTFTIPDSLKGQYQIAIRMQSPTTGLYAYNWFYNNTTP